MGTETNKSFNNPFFSCFYEMDTEKNVSLSKVENQQADNHYTVVPLSSPINNEVIAVVGLQSSNGGKQNENFAQAGNVGDEIGSFGKSVNDNYNDDYNESFDTLRLMEDFQNEENEMDCQSINSESVAHFSEIESEGELCSSDEEKEKSKKGLLKRGYILPDGCTWDIESIRLNGVLNGEVCAFQNNVIVDRLFFYNDELNGVQYHYTNGQVSREVSYANNIPHGICKKYDLKEHSIKKVYLYEQGRKVRCYKCSPWEDYWYWYDIDEFYDPSRFCICKVDGDFRRSGECFVFLNNNLKQIVVFQDDYVKYTRVLVVNSTSMIEYNKNMQKIYEGDYLFLKEKLAMLREGDGIEYEDGLKSYDGKWRNNSKNGRGISYFSNGYPSYDGEWVDDLKEGNGKSFVDGRLLYNGYWRRDVPHKKGTLYENGKEKYKGDWNEGVFVLDNGDYYDYTTKKLVVKSNSNSTITNTKSKEEERKRKKRKNELLIEDGIKANCEEVVSFSEILYDYLTIGRNNYNHSRRFEVKNCNSLKKIEVSEDSFHEAENGVFVIENCPQLKTIRIQENAFHLFSVFHLSSRFYSFKTP